MKTFKALILAAFAASLTAMNPRPKLPDDEGRLPAYMELGLESFYEEFTEGEGLSLSCDSPGAVIYIEQTEAGSGYAEIEPEPGFYWVRVKAPGMKTFEREFEVRAGRRLAVTVRLGGAVGMIAIQCEPWDASLSIGGRALPSASGPGRRALSFPAGSWLLEARRFGYRSFSAWVDIAEGRDASIDIKLERVAPSLWVSESSSGYSASAYKVFSINPTVPCKALIRVLDESGVVLTEEERILTGYDNSYSWIPPAHKSLDARYRLEVRIISDFDGAERQASLSFTPLDATKAEAYGSYSGLPGVGDVYLLPSLPLLGADVSWDIPFELIAAGKPFLALTSCRIGVAPGLEISFGSEFAFAFSDVGYSMRAGLSWALLQPWIAEGWGIGLGLAAALPVKPYGTPRSGFIEGVRTALAIRIPGSEIGFVDYTASPQVFIEPDGQGGADFRLGLGLSLGIPGFGASEGGYARLSVSEETEPLSGGFALRLPLRLSFELGMADRDGSVLAAYHEMRFEGPSPWEWSIGLRLGQRSLR
jgi:hypothetical protein